MARKAYLLKQLKHLEHNLAIAEKQADRWKTEEPIEIIKALSSAYQTLPLECFFHSSINDWNTQPHIKNQIDQKGLTFSTNSGLFVRSKSERTIADVLDRNRIPYQYEAALSLGSKTKYPDFTIRRPTNGELLLWEHFGCMHQEEYRQQTVNKLSLYAHHGFFPFDNLICTYEKDLQDVARIQELVETIF